MLVTQLTYFFFVFVGLGVWLYLVLMRVFCQQKNVYYFVNIYLLRNAS